MRTALTALLSLACANELAYRRSDIISSVNTHKDCSIHQGDSLTLLSCPSSFEIYKTQDIAQDWYEQPQNGEISKGIISPTYSREVGKADRLTYLQNGRDIMTAYADSDGNIVKEKLLVLSGIPTNTVFQDVWVFDSVAVTKKTTQEMVIYEMPVVKGAVTNPITMDFNNLQYDVNQLAYDFAVNVTKPHIFEQYAVTTGNVEKYVFTFSDKNKTLTFTSNMSTPYEEFDGKLYDLKVSEQFLIISCSDCTKP